MSTAELSPLPQPSRCTREEYLRVVRSADDRHEYLDGEMWPMVGASIKHGIIVSNLVHHLILSVGDKSMLVLASTMRVGTSKDYFYPDVLLVEGAPLLEDSHQDTLLNPLVIFEVLSPSTESFDRGKKFAAYRKMSSLREYVLVSQESPRVEHFRRVAADPATWMMTAVDGVHSTLHLLKTSAESPPLTLQLSQIYQRVQFETNA